MSQERKKQRILDILEILKQKTDEDSSITLGQINGHLIQIYGSDYKVDIRSLRDDIETLQSAGYKITETILSHNTKAYSIKANDFEQHELQLIADVLSSARFLEKSETRDLIKKVRGLTSISKGKQIESRVHLDGRIKYNYKDYRKNLNIINSALHEKRKISFKYGSYNMNKKFELHRKGDTYYAIPYALVWSRDFYYLIAKEGSREQASFRIDRMRDISVLEETFEEVSFDVNEYLKTTFNMYSATATELVKLECNKALIGSVIDRFGLEANIMPISEDKFILRAEVATNDGFLNWIMGYRRNARVLEPQSLVDRIKKEIENMANSYKDTP